MLYLIGIKSLIIYIMFKKIKNCSDGSINCFENIDQFE